MRVEKLINPPERPATLKPEFYRLILQTLPEQPLPDLNAVALEYGYKETDNLSFQEFVETVLDRPSIFLCRFFDLLHRPDLLAGSFIEFGDGAVDASIDYYIDETAADLIAKEAQMVILTRIQDGQPFGVPVKRITTALQKGCELDYKEIQLK